MHTLQENNISPLCTLTILMPKIIPLLALMLVLMWYEESNLEELVLPTPTNTPWVKTLSFRCGYNGKMPEDIPPPATLPERTSPTPSKLTTFHIADAWSSRKCPLMLWKEERKWINYKHLYYYVISFFCKVDYDSRKFIHTAKVHLQRGHVTTRTCRCCKVWVMFQVLYLAACLRMWVACWE